MIVTKAVKMAEMMNVPVLGLVENMSYFHCPDNGKDYQILAIVILKKSLSSITWMFWPNALDPQIAAIVTAAP